MCFSFMVGTRDENVPASLHSVSRPRLYCIYWAVEDWNISKRYFNIYFPVSPLKKPTGV
jgi:hypothetical protein